ncbi:helix-turn-helix domain-containing protein [bacterium]|nr:helix-turn-helix domain-containing protein [bacterium]
MTFKVGYVAKRSGLISKAQQLEHLQSMCDVIYDGELDEGGIDAAIQAIRGPEDLFVVYSTAVIGRPSFPRIIGKLSKLGVDLHSLEANETFPTRDGEAMKRAWDGIGGMERRNGKKGGRPSQYDSGKIDKLYSDGYNNKEIADIIGASPATVGRYLNRILGKNK